VILLCSQDIKTNPCLTSGYLLKTNEYPSLSLKAIKLLVVSSTSYLCEKAFSSMTLIKIKQRNRLDAEAELCVLETSLLLRLPLILASKQQQISH